MRNVRDVKGRAVKDGTVLAGGLLLCLLGVSLASCGKEVIPEATLTRPEPMSGESVRNVARRTELDPEDIRDYFPLKEDLPEGLPGAAGGTFVHEKYAGSSQASWNCHDPRLFQDPDSGKFYVYSTGWNNGCDLRSSDDLIHWARHGSSPFWDRRDVSLVYHHMHWDDDFLKWVGYVTNDGTSYGTDWYKPTSRPNSWAPAVVKQDGRYYMFHGIITDSLSYARGFHPAAAITLAIADKPEGPFIPAKEYDPGLYANSTLVRYVWSNKSAQNTEVGYWGCCNTGEAGWNRGFGAIDPEFVLDVATGKLMTYKIGGNECYAMTYGSWKGGIALVYVDAQTFKPVAVKSGTSTFNGKQYRKGDEMDAPLDSVDGNCGLLIAGGSGAAYEGAQLIYNSRTGWYYIFVSMGDLTFEYRVGVGRSRKIEGPYLDTSGRAMAFGSVTEAEKYHSVGGKIIGAVQLRDEYGFMSPGGQSVFRSRDGKILFACHTRTNFKGTGDFCLQIRQMFFTDDGWPVLNQNEYWNDYGGQDEALARLSADDIAGTYDSVLTVRGSRKGSFRTGTIKVNGMHVDDARPTESKELVLNADGTLGGGYTGAWKLGKDGCTITLTLQDKDGDRIGTFGGYALRAYDWARKGADCGRHTITFTTVDGRESGEYFWGNRRP